MRQQYREFKFQTANLDLIDTIDTIITDYQRQGYTLTVRQLYYQLVARAVIPNTEKSYKRITNLVNDARLAGLLDWDGIEDRTRAFVRRSNWNTGAEILDSAARSFHMDMWEGQHYRPFVIVEKEALAGVMERVCHTYDVPVLAARGYPSVTVLRDFARGDIREALEAEQQPVLLHFGDHDPSGIDMTRDLRERIGLFAGEYPGSVILKRIALNMSQVEELKPPPNPAKTTDSRFAEYMANYGDESWELDALEPSYITALVEGNVTKLIDQKLWDARKAEIAEIKTRLATLAETF